MITANDLVEAIRTDKEKGAGIPGFMLIFSVIDFDYDWASLLHEVQGKVEDKDISKLLRPLWCMTTRGIDSSKVRDLFKKYGMDSMTEDDKKLYDEISDGTTVYRAGGNSGAGLSWSLSKDMALNYAGGNPDLVEQTKVPKDKILAVYDAGESEVIFDAYDD